MLILNLDFKKLELNINNQIRCFSRVKRELGAT
jgi:hypothetical protein